jgi:hypothetical protein
MGSWEPPGWLDLSFSESKLPKLLVEGCAVKC